MLDPYDTVTRASPDLLITGPHPTAQGIVIGGYRRVNLRGDRDLIAAPAGGEAWGAFGWPCHSSPGVPSLPPGYRCRRREEERWQRLPAFAVSGRG